jgi:hypothetical protein
MRPAADEPGVQAVLGSRVAGLLLSSTVDASQSGRGWAEVAWRSHCSCSVSSVFMS